MQVLPLVGWVIARRQRSAAQQRALVHAAAAAYTALVGILLSQALRGESVASPGAATVLCLGLATASIGVAVVSAMRRTPALEAL